MIYLLIGAIIFLILANTIFSLNQSYRNERNYIAVRKTYQLIETANLLLSTVKDAEAGQRGYLITDDSTYLIPYAQNERKIRNIYIRLFALANSLTNLKPKLEHLNSLINLKLGELHTTIVYNQNNRREDALNIVKSQVGNNYMTQIREATEQIIGEEKTQLDLKNQAIDKLNFKIQVFSVVSNWLLLVVVVAALIDIMRNREKIAALFIQIGKKNDMLELQKAELQNASKDLVKQNSDLERFAYVASHDLRSPTANQLALLKLFDEAKTQEERDLFIDSIRQVSESLLIKLDDLIETLKTSYDAPSNHKGQKFHHVYDNVIKNLSVEIKNSDAKITCDFSKAPEINIPKSYLESILQNLLSNALKYRDPKRKPEIFIESYNTGNSTCFKVSDNGLGIDLAEHGDAIFGIYQTFHNHKDGKGVGLYITKAQILSINGTIDVKSQPNEGTTFTVCI